MVKLLKDIKLFSCFEPDELEAISRLGQAIEADSFSNIVIEGEMSWSLFIVVEGRVGVYKSGQLSGNAYDLGEIAAGGFFGEMSLVDDKPRSATVRALVASKLFKIERDQFQEYLSQDEGRRLRFYENCIRLLFARLRDLGDSYVVSQYHLWRVALDKNREVA